MSLWQKELNNWLETARAWLHPKAIAMLFLGFSAGIPILLIFSTLSLWLREAGVERAAVTFFSWAALGYSFKFIWAPLVDLLPLPLFTRLLGRRRGWMLLSQILVIISIIWMSSVDPSRDQTFLTAMALAAVMLGFSSATQDIVIDAYRIECAKESLQALLASMYIAGYRVGMLIAGAGSLYIAGYFGTEVAAYSYLAWQKTYLIMALFMGVGIATTVIISEPGHGNDIIRRNYSYSVKNYLEFTTLFICAVTSFSVTFFYCGDFIGSMIERIGGDLKAAGGAVPFVIGLVRLFCSLVVAGIVAATLVKVNLVNRKMVKNTYVEPVREFFVRYGVGTSVLLLFIVGFYRVSDIVLGVVSNLFYLDMGYSKNVIATVTKSFGLAMTITGGFLGGLLTVRYGVMAILFTGALLSSITNLLFMVLAESGENVYLLSFVIGADNLSAGIATTAFVAFLSSLTNVSFTAVQYAIFSSLMTLFPKVIGGYTGTMVTTWGYDSFFLITALMGIPVMILIVVARNKLHTSS